MVVGFQSPTATPSAEASSGQGSGSGAMSTAFEGACSRPLGQRAPTQGVSGSYFAYEIQVGIPNGNVATIEDAPGLGAKSDINGLGYSGVYNLPVGVNALVDAGLAPPPVVSGEVWSDNDGDGILDNNDSGGMADVTVNLDNAQSQMLMTTTTDANGNYQFTVPQSILNQDSGSGMGSGFEIQVVIPANYAATMENVSGPGINSNIDAQGDSSIFMLYPAGTQTINGGLIPPATVSGEVWYDSDGDGLLDNGEFGMPGASVNLDNAQGITLLSTNTDANGNYQFTVPASLFNWGSGTPLPNCAL